MNAPVHFRWLGTAGIELREDQQVLVIDPYFTRFPFWRMWLGRVHPNRRLIAEKIQCCDFVLVTHAHWDHVMDVPDVAQNTGAMVLGSPNTCRLAALCGLPEQQIREIRVGEELSLGHFQIEVLQAKHMRTPGFTPGPLSSDFKPPLRARDYQMDDNFSFVISVGAHRLLTDPGEDPKSAVPADVLFVNPRQYHAHYASLLHLVGPKVVIPNHWDDFFRPLSKPLCPYFKAPRWAFPPLQRTNLTEFRRVIEALGLGVKVFIPEILRVYALSEIM